MSNNINLSIEEKAKKFDEAISSKEGLSKFLEENYLVADWGGTVDISGLTFSHNVNISRMTITKEDGILDQDCQVADTIMQSHQTAKLIIQDHQKANIIFQGWQNAKQIEQNNQIAKFLDQSSQTVSDDFIDYKLKKGEKWEDCGDWTFCVRLVSKKRKINKSKIEENNYEKV
ncbi:MAG: hypothetical protein M0R51_15285 [Clostridia bacterium]|jgi:hypothetical protein|nr:hypothetical protein [Clostridia bacterium]